MGAPSGQNVSAYPTAGAVMNRARAFVNDSYKGGAGLILTNTAPFTTEYLNGALEELQDRLGNSSAEIILTQDNIILTPIPALAQPDPSVQISVTYTGVVTPTGNIATPAIPANVIAVEKLWERQTGSGLDFQPMHQPMEGLPSILQGPWLRYWEYRQDAIYLTGSTQTEDLRMRAQIRQVPIAASDAAELNNVQIGILASVNALATLVAYNFARARGAPAAQVMSADAEKFMRYIVNRYTRRAQSVTYIRRGYGNYGDRRTTGFWW